MDHEVNQHRLPAEWETQSFILMTWPHRHSDWRSSLNEVTTVYAKLAQVIAQTQKLMILCYDPTLQASVKKRLRATCPTENIHTVLCPSNDTWIRDYGPITLYQGKQRLCMDFQFNAWGGKYPCQWDNLVNDKLAHTTWLGDCTFKKSPWVIEGGALECNGDGTLLTTASCLFDTNRNVAPNQIEQSIADLLGIKQMIILNHGKLEGDDTDGHIDTLARFFNCSSLLYSDAPEPDHPSFQSLRAMHQELKNTPFDLVALPTPTLKSKHDGRLLPANYANFQIINEAVLCPSYGLESDDQACATLQSCFPDRKVHLIDSRPLIEQNGSHHCALMSVPA
jgi:agmatine deiminase